MNKEKQTSIKLDEQLYNDCKKKLLSEHMSFKSLVIGCINLYLSGSINFIQSVKLVQSGSLS